MVSRHYIFQAVAVHYLSRWGPAHRQVLAALICILFWVVAFGWCCHLPKDAWKIGRGQLMTNDCCVALRPQVSCIWAENLCAAVYALGSQRNQAASRLLLKPCCGLVSSLPAPASSCHSRFLLHLRLNFWEMCSITNVTTPSACMGFHFPSLKWGSWPTTGLLVCRQQS